MVLAETLGSWASYLVACDDPAARVAGIEVSGSHVWAVSSGTVTGVARPIRLGRSLHFWRIDIHDQDNNLCCSAKLTVKVGAAGIPPEQRILSTMNLPGILRLITGCLSCCCTC